MPTIFTARWLLPMVAPPLENGALVTDGTKIVAVGPRVELQSRYPESPIDDFGEAVILPGLVNAHSHLELTTMRGFLEREEADFFAWLRKLTIARMSMTPEDLVVSATWGAIEAARSGVTCLGDSSSVAVHSMKALNTTGLRGIVYQESFGPDPRLAHENVSRLNEQLSDSAKFANERVHAGVSPHAPYTVSAPQLELISRLALDKKLPLMMHAAESEAEMLFLLKGEGPFADGLRKRGIEWQVPGVATIEYLQRQGILETQPLLAHCIHVDDAELELMDHNHVGIAHCPTSNAKLRHGHAPFANFLAHELKVGLGSDSVASNNMCDILAEARFATLLARLASTTESAINPERVLFAATLGGARAVGLEDQIGALAPGMEADITVVGINGVHQQPAGNPFDTLIFSSSGRDVIATFVAGHEIYRNGRVKTVDEVEFSNAIQTVRARIEQAL